MRAGICVLIALPIMSSCLAEGGVPSEGRTEPDHTPLGAVQLHFARGLESEASYAQPYTFGEDWFSYKVPVFREHLSTLEGREDLAYLEVGVWEGRSFFWMLENYLAGSRSEATAVDLFPDSVATESGVQRPYATFLSNLRLSGFEDRVTVHRGLSRETLKGLESTYFDLIYVDASHIARNVLRDGLLAWDLLKPGGILIFDDYTTAEEELPAALRPGAAIDAFVMAHERDVEVIHWGLQVFLRKQAAPACRTDATDPNTEFVTPVGRYCYYWNYYAVPGSRMGLYDGDVDLGLTESQRAVIERMLTSRSWSTPIAIEDLRAIGVPVDGD